MYPTGSRLIKFCSWGRFAVRSAPRLVCLPMPPMMENETRGGVGWGKWWWFGRLKQERERQEGDECPSSELPQVRAQRQGARVSIVVNGITFTWIRKTRAHQYGGSQPLGSPRMEMGLSAPLLWQLDNREGSDALAPFGLSSSRRAQPSPSVPSTSQSACPPKSCVHSLFDYDRETPFIAFFSTA